MTTSARSVLVILRLYGALTSFFFMRSTYGVTQVKFEKKCLNITGEIMETLEDIHGGICAPACGRRNDCVAYFRRAGKCQLFREIDTHTPGDFQVYVRNSGGLSSCPSPSFLNCLCPPGYIMSDDLQTCKDLDECANNPCDDICENKLGTYNCSCNDGRFQGVNKHRCTACTSRNICCFTPGGSFLGFQDMSGTGSATRANFIEASFGIVTSPLHPGVYENFMERSIGLRVPDGKRIHIHFLVFDTEASHDYVRIYDGHSTSFTRIAELHGLISPDDVTTSGQEVFITFITDRSVVRTGFRFIFKAV